MRGLWVVRTALVSPEAVDQVVDEAAEGGFNALFVQVRGRGDAFYARGSWRAARCSGTSRPTSTRSRGCSSAPGTRASGARLGQRAADRALRARCRRTTWCAQHPEWMMVPRSGGAHGLPRRPAGLLWRIRQAGRGPTATSRATTSRPRRPGSPSTSKPWCASSCAVPGGRLAPRLHPLPGPGLRLLGRGPRGRSERAAGRRDLLRPPAQRPRPGTSTGARRSTASPRGSRRRPRRAAGHSRSRRRWCPTSDRGGPEVPGLAGLAGAAAARRALPDDLHPGQPRSSGPRSSRRRSSVRRAGALGRHRRLSPRRRRDRREDPRRARVRGLGRRAVLPRVARARSFAAAARGGLRARAAARRARPGA